MAHRIALAAVVLVLSAVAAPGQLKIDQDVYPDVWNKPLEEEEEEAPPPPPPTYSGDPVVLPAACTEGDDGSGQQAEIAGAVAGGDRIFAFGDLHRGPDTLQSLLFLSEDGGGTWTEAAPPIERAVLDAAQFVDAQNGWISGFEEVSPAQFQPFFLATSDGGERWRRWDVAPGSEERFGTIVAFRFDSPKHGYAIVERTAAADRFELYETFNAGRAWSIRRLQPERPRIPGGRRVVRSEEWRVEPEGGAWRAERDSGGEWALVARFAVQTLPCAPPVSSQAPALSGGPPSLSSAP